MRILLDESVPTRFKQLIKEHEVRTVQEEGWRSMENGELLALSSQRFDVFVTPDQNLPHQQNLSSFDIAVVVLAAKSNRMAAYEPLAERIREAIASAETGKATWVTA